LLLPRGNRRIFAGDLSWNGSAVCVVKGTHKNGKVWPFF
jgi:hypothetical protein